MKAVMILFLVIGSVQCSDNDDYDPRIVGGSDAPEGLYPYQVSLRSPSGKHFCGGSIISPYFILTAAHCVYGQPASSVLVVAGTNQLSTAPYVYTVAEIISHEAYTPNGFVNDIALLKVNGPINFNIRVQPISLANNAPAPGTSCILTGWGLTLYPGSIPNNLQQIILFAIPIQECANILVGYSIFNSNVCTYRDYGQGACQGDSGGPLVCGNVQCGIVSWGIPCAKGAPDVYTSVSFYRNWIAYSANL